MEAPVKICAGEDAPPFARAASITEEGEIVEDAQRMEHKEAGRTGPEVGEYGIQGKPTILFVSRIPDGCTRDSLQKLFEVYGEVFDIYISKRKDKSGRNFGFVKYRYVKDGLRLEANIHKFVVHNTRLFVCRAKFDRFGNSVEVPVSKISGVPVQPSQQDGNSNKSYLNALINGAPSKSNTIVISPDFVAHSEQYKSVLLGRVVDFLTLRNIHILIAETNYQGLRIRYLGGFYILLTFFESNHAEEFLESQGIWSKWFTSMRRWEAQSVCYERIAWIRILGVPAHLWDRSVLNSIGSQVGKVIQGSQVSWEDGNWSQDCIGVLVGDGCLINVEYNLKWRDKTYRVWIREEPGEWQPDCLEKIPQHPSPVSSQPVDDPAPTSDLGAAQQTANVQYDANDPRVLPLFEIQTTNGSSGDGTSPGNKVSSKFEIKSAHGFGCKEKCQVHVEKEVSSRIGNSTPSGPYFFKAVAGNSKRTRPNSLSPSSGGSPLNPLNLSFMPISKKRSRCDPDPFRLDDVLGLNNLFNPINPDPFTTKLVEPPPNPTLKPHSKSSSKSVVDPLHQSGSFLSGNTKNGLGASIENGDPTLDRGIIRKGAGNLGRKQKKGVKLKYVKIGGITAPAPSKPVVTSLPP